MPDSSASPSKLPLSDEELKALGLVVAYWARAEIALETTLAILAVNDREQFSFKSERLISFSEKASHRRRLP